MRSTSVLPRCCCGGLGEQGFGALCSSTAFPAGSLMALFCSGWLPTHLVSECPNSVSSDETSRIIPISWGLFPAAAEECFQPGVQQCCQKQILTSCWRQGRGSFPPKVSPKEGDLSAEVLLVPAGLILGSHWRAVCAAQPCSSTSHRL